MSNQFLKLRRSSVPGKVPTTSSLEFGEIALNTYDGLAFIKKSGSNGEEIITIGSTSGNFSGSFTGSLYGTASWALNTLTASFVQQAVSASYALTASWAINSLTASSADNFEVRGSLTGSDSLFTGTITAQTLHVQYVTASTEYITGSTIFGTQLTDTHQFTGSVSVTGSLSVDGPLNATSSWAINALTASYVENSQTSSFVTASNVYGPYGENSVLTASYSVTASWALDANLTSSNAITRSGSAFILGGRLYQSTSIDGTGAGTLDNLYPYESSSLGYKFYQQVVEDPITKKIYLAGAFITYNNLPVSWSFIRLNPDLSLDNTFNLTPPGIVLTQSSGGGPIFGEGFVRKIILDKTNGKIYVGGSFVSASGVLAGGLVRYNEDGTLDNTYITNGAFAGGSGTQIQRFVYDMELDSNGKLVVVGNFTSYSGSSGNNYIIRINPDGSKDTSFDNSTGFNASGTSVTLDTSGNIYAVGTFTSYKGVSANRIVGIKPDGTRNTTFNVGTGLNASPGNPFIQYSPDGKVVVTGASFTAYSGSSAVKIAKINLNGTIDSNFSSGTGFGSTIPALAFIDQYSRIYIGTYTTAASLVYNGTTLRQMCRLLPNGTVDTTFIRWGPGFGTGTTNFYKGAVNISGSNYYGYVAGGFDSYDGDTNKKGLARIRLDGYPLNISGSVANYDLDYSYLYTDRTLVDKAYVDNKFTGSFFSGSITGSLFGTSSWSLNSQTASFVTASNVWGPFGSNSVISSSYALTASYAINAGISDPFPYTGSAIISGSLEVTGSVSSTGGFTGSLLGTSSWAQNAVSSSYPIAVFGDTLYSVAPTAGPGFTNNNGIFLGLGSGYDANNAPFSNFLGFYAGYSASNASNSNFFGASAGERATNAENSNFFGQWAGYEAINASYSNLIGYYAGTNNNGPSFSENSLGIGRNNIIIGTNITLEDGRQDSINIGGLLFGTGSYYSTSTQSSGSANGRIGITQPDPQFSLDVSGSGRYTDGLQVTASLNAPNITGSLFGTSSWAFNVLTASFVTASNVYGPFGSNSVISSSYALTASFALNAGGAAASPTNQIATGSVTASVNVGTSSFQLTSASVQLLSVSSSGLITGQRMFLSASQNTVSGSTLTLYGSGSAQPVFTVQGSQGELFSVTDSLSGSLFSVNDISGLPIIEAFSDNRVLIGSYQAPALFTTVRTTSTAGNNVIYQNLPTASYDGAFFDYTVKSGSNARAGQITAIWSGSAVNYTETTTTDFGDTSGVRFMVMITGSNMALTGSFPSVSWTIKTIVRSI